MRCVIPVPAAPHNRQRASGRASTAPARPEAQPPAQSANERVLTTPVELERLSGVKAEGNERCPPRGVCLFSPPAADPVGYPGITAGVSQRLNLLVELLGRAPLPAVAVLVGQYGVLKIFDPVS